MNSKFANAISHAGSFMMRTAMITLLAFFSTASFASALDCVEDGAEKVGAIVEENWEKLEDGLFGESAEERAEEARERAADRAEELQEEREGRACKYKR